MCAQTRLDTQAVRAFKTLVGEDLQHRIQPLRTGHQHRDRFFVPDDAGIVVQVKGLVAGGKDGADASGQHRPQGRGRGVHDRAVGYLQPGAIRPEPQTLEMAEAVTVDFDKAILRHRRVDHVDAPQPLHKMRGAGVDELLGEFQMQGV